MKINSINAQVSNVSKIRKAQTEPLNGPSNVSFKSTPIVAKSVTAGIGIMVGVALLRLVQLFSQGSDKNKESRTISDEYEKTNTRV